MKFLKIKIRRLFAAVLAVMTVFSSFAVTVNAIDVPNLEVCVATNLGGEFLCLIDKTEGVVTLRGMDTEVVPMKEAGTLVIPSEVRGYPVTEISGVLVSGYEDLAQYIYGIEIPDTVTSIRAGAFKGLTALTEIEIPEGVTKIPDRAFYGDSALVSVELPTGITAVGNYAFTNSGIETIDISGASELGSDVFAGCGKLEEVILPEQLTAIPARMFMDCASLRTVEIPETVEMIEHHAFANSGLESIVIPASVTTIESYAFSGSGVKNIVLPETITTIEQYTFANTGLESITIPASVETIGGYAFSGSALKSVTIPSTVKNFGSNIFAECRYLAKAEFAEGVEKVSAYMFEGCESLTDVSFPSTLRVIESRAFRYSGLTTVTFPDQLVKIGDYAFAYTPLRYINNLLCNEEIACEVDIGDSVFYKSDYFNDPENWWGGGLYLGDILLDIEPDEIPYKGFTIKDGTRYMADCFWFDVMYELRSKKLVVPASLERTNVVVSVLFRTGDYLNHNDYINFVYNGTEEQFYEKFTDEDLQLIKRKYKSFRFYKIVAGDVDGDGEITMADALLMRKYLAKIVDDSYIDVEAADINEDGKLNAKDQLMIRMALAA